MSALSRWLERLLRPRAPLLARIELLQTVLARAPGATFQMQRLASGTCSIPFVSAGVHEMLELTEEQVQRDYTLCLERIVPEQRAHFAQLIAHSFATLSAWSGEWQVQLPRQGLRWHKGQSATPVSQADGSCLWVVQLQDITEHKQLQDELAQHRDNLSALVHERTLALNQALHTAEAGTRAKSEFLSNISHEIRTPLNAIIGLAQVGLRTPQLAIAQPYLTQIQESGRLLLELVDDVLDVARVEAGRLTLEAGTVVLRQEIARSVALLRPRAQAKGLELQVELDAELPQAIGGDSKRLLQVLNNLLSNAVKFTSQGVVLLRAQAALHEGAGWLHLSVLDTGIGMGPEQIARLFSPFMQGDTSIARKYGGSGLGLTITKHLVELMGGRIELSSQPGVGSCFTVRLPVQLAALPAAASGPAAQPALLQRLAGLRVLAAEDDAVNQWVLRELLEQEGAFVLVCPDGQRALDLLATPQVFDVLVTDIQMAGLNGYETASRALALRPGLPVVGLTAYAMEEQRQRCLAAGMVAHVTKPVDLDVLVQALLLATRQRVPVAADGPQPAPRATPQLVDWAELQRRLSKPDSRRQFLQTFIDSYRAAPAALRQYLCDGERQALQHLAHKLIGAAGFLGALRVHHAARQLEELLLYAHSLPAASVEHLADLLQQVLDELARHLQSNEASP